MKRVFFVVFLHLLSALVQAQPETFMQARLLDTQGELTHTLAAKVGQRVTLALDIYTPTWFTRAPKLQPLVVDGAAALQAQGFGINFSERRDGITYTVQRRELSIFPQRVGQFIVPSQIAEVWLADATGQAGELITVRSEPLLFQVSAVVSSGVSLGAPAPLVANQLTLEETFEPSLESLLSGAKTLRAGDAIVRKVTFTAAGTLGMLIQPVIWHELKNVKQQARHARVTDRTVRGEFTGVRQESRHYVFERAGQYQLPAQNVYWWDSENQQLQTASLAARNLEVLPSALAVSEAEPALDMSQLHKRGPAILIGLSILLVAGYVLWRLSRLLLSLWRQRLQRYRASLAYAQRQLLQACAGAEPEQIVECFYVWRERLPRSSLKTPQWQALQVVFTAYYQRYYTCTNEQNTENLQHLTSAIRALSAVYHGQGQFGAFPTWSRARRAFTRASTGRGLRALNPQPSGAAERTQL